MKYSCNIIKDLLPLYSDQVCSDESNLIIEEHLRECEDCKKTLEVMNQGIKILSEHTDTEQIKSLAKKWKHSKMTAFIWGATVAFILVFIVLLISSIIGYHVAGGAYVSPDGILHENFEYFFVGFWSFVFMVLGFMSLFIQKTIQKTKDTIRYKRTSLTILITSVVLLVITQFNFNLNSKVLSDGTLVEPFYLVPVSIVLSGIALMSAVSLIISLIYEKSRK